jgi:hypothetical protein
MVSVHLLPSPTSDVGPYRVAHRVPKVSQYLSAVWLVERELHPRHLKDTRLTPAKTLVMSSTLIPARGRLDASLFAAWVVAMLREMMLRQLYCGR